MPDVGFNAARSCVGGTFMPDDVGNISVSPSSGPLAESTRTSTFPPTAYCAGAVAAITTSPVIGVPLVAPNAIAGGLDALLSIVQMPRGVPVATVAVGEAGAANAGILAAQILATADEELAGRLRMLREGMAAKVLAG